MRHSTDRRINQIGYAEWLQPAQIEECRLRYRKAYPSAADGTVTVPFSRPFIVPRAAT